MEIIERKKGVEGKKKKKKEKKLEGFKYSISLPKFQSVPLGWSIAGRAPCADPRKHYRLRVNGLLESRNSTRVGSLLSWRRGPAALTLLNKKARGVSLTCLNSFSPFLHLLSLFLSVWEFNLTRKEPLEHQVVDERKKKGYRLSSLCHRVCLCV